MQRPRGRLAILIAVLLLGACSSLKSPDDTAIATDIQARLFNDPVLKTRDIRVASSNGIVTISGTVGTNLEKAAVERLATEETGVRSVVNMLAVASQPAPGGEVESAESTPPPAVAPRAAPRTQPAPHKTRHAHRAPAARGSSSQDKASAELEAYTNSLAAPASSPAPAPSAAAAAPATPAPVPMPAAPAAPPTPTPAPKPTPKPQERVTVPAGTVLTIRMVDSIDSRRNHSGDEFAATLDSPIVVDDRVVAARGGDARVRLVDVQSAGRISGQSQLQLELVAVTMNGVSYPTVSGYYEQHGGSRGRRTAETVGGGAILGALIGGVLGRGKGAAIGSAVGAGTGAAVQVSTKGQQVKIPAETKIDFTLKDPVDVPVGGGN